MQIDELVLKIYIKKKCTQNNQKFLKKEQLEDLYYFKTY